MLHPFLQESTPRSPLSKPLSSLSPFSCLGTPESLAETTQCRHAGLTSRHGFLASSLAGRQAWRTYPVASCLCFLLFRSSRFHLIAAGLWFTRSDCYRFPLSKACQSLEPRRCKCRRKGRRLESARRARAAWCQKPCKPNSPLAPSPPTESRIQ